MLGGLEQLGHWHLHQNAVSFGHCSTSGGHLNADNTQDATWNLTSLVQAFPAAANNTVTFVATVAPGSLDLWGLAGCDTPPHSVVIHKKSDSTKWLCGTLDAIENATIKCDTLQSRAYFGNPDLVKAEAWAKVGLRYEGDGCTGANAGVPGYSCAIACPAGCDTAADASAYNTYVCNAAGQWEGTEPDALNKFDCEDQVTTI